MDDDLKKLLRALSEAVNESLMNSSAFVNAISTLWRAGQDASDSIDASAADEEALCDAEQEPSDAPVTLTLTADDEYFLRALRITCPV